MQNNILDINWLDLFVTYSLLLIPIYVFWYFKTGLVKDTIIAAIRMTLQLLALGVYLEVLFRLNNLWLNLLWGIIMIIIASYTTIKRSELNMRLFFLPTTIALSLAIFLIDLYFFKAVLKLDYFFEARYFIPITGMLLGNALRSNIIALNAYFSRLSTENQLYKFAIANGASQKEALLPFFRDAIKKAFNPSIATMAIMGLISLPGMMTGQILSGTTPTIAIKYQILIMITIFVSSMLTVMFTVLISNRFIFDEYKNLKTNILQKQ